MNDDINVHFIFPTVIYTAKLGNYNEYDKILKLNIEPYNFTTKSPEVPDGYRMTGEHLGKISIHHNPLFYDFFKQISLHAKTYVQTLGMREDVFDYYITKCWLSIIDIPETHMSYHIHSNADICFVYYLEIPENADCISFSNVHKPNQLFKGLMDDGRIDIEKNKTFFRERNVTNYNSFFIPPQEGLLVMWPGHIPHGTVTNPNTNKKQNGRRVGVVGDINLILKPGYEDFESGRISMDFLRKFD